MRIIDAMSKKREKKSWDVSDYTWSAVVAVILGVLFVANGGDFLQIMGVLLLLLGAGWGIVAAVTKANQMGQG